MTKTVQFELSEEQAEFLQAEAQREERSVDEVVSDLVKQRMAYDAWFRRKVQEASTPRIGVSSSRMKRWWRDPSRDGLSC